MKRICVIGLAGLVTLCEAACAGSGLTDAGGQGAAQTSLLASQAGNDGAVTSAWVQRYGGYTNHGEAALQSAQARLDHLRQQDSKLDAYATTKSQCWLNVARQEIAMGDKWGNVGEALYESERINTELAEGNPESLGVPALRTVLPVRPDLMAHLHAAAGDSGYERCPHARRLVACGEVMLAYAGHLAWESDKTASERMIGRVEKIIRTLDADLRECAVELPQPDMPTAGAAGAPAAVVLRPTSTLFAFDRGDLRGMLPQGAQALDGLLTQLSDGPPIDRVDVAGYTDRLGSDSYDLRLSGLRAHTVATYLSAHGLQVPIQAVGLGKQAPVVDCPDRDTAQLIRCLQPNRRVEITVHER